MIKQSLIQGYTALDNCYKYNDPDSTIDCYVFTRDALKGPLKTTELVLNTNLVYALVGKQNGKDKVYVGQASRNTKPLTRILQHMSTQASTKEKYYPFWEIALVFVSNNTNPADQWGTDTIDDLEALLIKDTQSDLSWNSKDERIRNPLSPDRIRSHSRKLLDIREYVSYLGFNFFNRTVQPEDNVKATYEERLDAEEKQLIDNTVSLEAVNLEPNATTPEYTTPESIVKQMLNIIPWSEFDETTKFFDPACKGGEFLALIHDRMMKRLYELDFKSDLVEPERTCRVHEHIVNKQLFGIAIGDNSYRVAKERAYSCPNIIKAPDNYIAGLLTETKEHIEKENEGTNKMKFDVIIGNPPYNDTDETGSSKSINTLFVDAAINLNAKYMVYIMPDRWFVSPDSLNAHCRKILAGKIRYLRDFNDTDVLFDGVSIRGGVSYFLYDKDYNGQMIYEDNTGKVNVRHDSNLMCKSCRSNILYNHVKAITKEYMNAEWISTSFFGLTRNASGSVIQTDDLDITLKSSKEDTYMNIKDIPRHKEYAGLYKVAIPYSAMSPRPFILMPNEICTLTYIIIRFFNNIDEAQNCKKYMETNFFKTLFNGLKTKLGTTKENLMCIPLQDFHPIELQKCADNEKIDWSKSLEDIDKQLYAKYKITDKDEIDFISGKTNILKKKTQYTTQDLEANHIYKQLTQN